MYKIQHGCYSVETKFQVKKHDYAAAESSDYVELLEIMNPPSGKERFVVNHYNAWTKYEFCETKTLAIAKKAFSAVASGFHDNIFNAWKDLGIEKMYRTLSPIAHPWFYAKKDQFFGYDNEFSISGKLDTADGKVSIGFNYFIFSEKNVFCFEQAEGVVDNDTVLWESSRISPLSSLRMISESNEHWKSNKAISKWLKFLSTGEDTCIELEFPIWKVVLDLSHENGTLYLRLSVHEEFKGERASQTYWKDRKLLTKNLFFSSGYPSSANTIIDVLKFFIS